MTSHQLVNQTSGDVELYTPPTIIEAARTAMGGIDLDPASCDYANEHFVKATAYWTALEDGLSQEWHGRVWMNHPFGKAEKACEDPCKKKTCQARGYHRIKDKPGNADWINKLVHEYTVLRTTAACCITFASTSEAWFKPLLLRPQCFLTPRTNYITPDGKVADGVTKGSVVTYFGTDVWSFYQAFRELGVIHVPYKLTA
jgi:hypothetical protein